MIERATKGACVGAEIGCAWMQGHAPNSNDTLPCPPSQLRGRHRAFQIERVPRQDRRAEVVFPLRSVRNQVLVDPTTIHGARVERRRDLTRRAYLQERQK